MTCLIRASKKKIFCLKYAVSLIVEFSDWLANMPIELRFHKLSENAITPTRGSEYAAGFDLSSAETKANVWNILGTDNRTPKWMWLIF